MADQCIGKLYLDISQVKKDIAEVNEFLGKIGANVNISDKIDEKITSAMRKLVNEAKKAGEEAGKALKEGIEKANFSGLDEKIKGVSSAIETVTVKFNKAGEEVSRVTTTIAKGLDEAGNKVTEVTNKSGDIVKQTTTTVGAFSEVVNKLKEYYNLQVQIKNAESSGNNVVADGLRAQLAPLEEYINKLKEAKDGQYELAMGTEEVQNAQNRLNSAMVNADQKAYTQGVKDYAEALKDLYAKQTELAQKMASGEIQQGSEAYDRLQESIQKASNRVQELGAKIGENGRKEANEIDSVVAAQERLRDIQERIATGGNLTYLERVQIAYNQLRDAIERYNIAKKTGDSQGMAISTQQIQATMQEVEAIKQAVSQTNMEAVAKEKVLGYIRQCETAQMKANSETQTQTVQTNTLNQQVNGLVSRYMSLVAVIRTITNLIKQAVEYVTEYSKKMNEIQMITLKTDQEVADLGKTYRQLAADMSVSSLDMADAAIYFTRQGLAAEEIEERLKNVTMFAKAANVEFSEAADKITAVVNSMQLVEQEAEDGRNATERVADVFLAVGDNAATSGTEIAEAMQKAAASAGSFGVSFEWLSAYIASVSETTRQEARTIGTALNTIIARLHQIKQSGYNSEDETKVNDVAKALSKVGITLLDQNNEWRNMTDIFTEISEQWGDLDGKTKSYIATTMAGVKQQNVFFALMNDLSKGIDGGSRAWELYEIAMNSAGTATEKYAVYQDSLEAATNRLTIAQERFYSLLNEGVIKTVKNQLADAINELTNGIELLSTSRFDRLGGVVSNAVNQVSNYIDAQKKLTESFDNIGKVVDGKIYTLQDYYQELDDIGNISPIAAEAIGQLKAGVLSQADAFKIVNEEMDKYIEKSQKMALAALMEQNLEWTPGQSQNVEFAQLMEYWNWLAENKKQQTKDLGLTDWANTLYNLSNMLVDEQMRSMGIDNRQSIMPKEMYEYLDELWVKQFNGAMPDIGTDAFRNGWETIASLFWQEFSDSMTQESNVEDVMKKEVEDSINRNIQALAAKGFDGIELKALGAKMLDAILGDDGELSEEEYQNHAKMINDFILKIYKGININELISRTDVAEQIALSIFDKDQLGDFFDDMGEEYARDFINAYQNLLDLGFKETDIKDLWIKSGAPINDLADIDTIVRESLLQSIGQAMGLSGATALRQYAEYLPDQLHFTDLDTATLKTVQNMIDMGVEVEDIENILMNATSIDEFKEKIKDLGVETEKTTDSLDEGSTSWADYIKMLKTSESEISNLEDVIEKRKKGEAPDDGKWRDLIEAHPDMLTMINDLDALSAKLEEFKATRQGIIKNMILQTKEYMNASPWKNEIDELEESFESLQAYRDFLIANEKDVTELDNWIAEATANVDATLQSEETVKTFEDFISEVKKAESELSKIDSLLETIKDGKEIKLSDLLDLAKSHPELLAAANDLEALKKALEDIKGTDVDQFEANFRKMILDSEEVAKNSPFASMLDPEKGIKTLADISTVDSRIIEDYIYQTMATFMNATGMLEDAGARLTGAFIDALFPDASMDLMNRKMISAEEMLAAGWKDFEDDIATVYSSTYTAGEEGLAWNQNIVMNLTPITPDGKVLTPDELDKYVEDLLAKSANMDELFKNDAEGLNLLINVSAVAEDESFDDAVAKAESLMELLHKIHEYMYGQPESEKSWLQQTVEAANQAAEENWAKSNNYIEQISAMQEALASGDGASALDIWNEYDKSMRKSIAETYPELAAAMYEVEKAIGDTNDEMDGSEDKTEKLKRATDKLSSALQKSSKYATAKNFTSTYEAIRKLEKGTISATDAYETFNKELDTVKKAGEDITDVNEKMAAGTEVTVSDVSNLAKVLGMSAEEILQDWPNAVQAFDDMTGAAGELQAVFDELNKAAFIRITGVSEADFSNITNGLLSVQGMAEETIDMLIATGQWELDKIPLNGMVSVLENGKLVQKYLTGYQSVLKATGNNPYKGRGGSTTTDTKTNKGGGGGGGGGGDKSSNEMTEVERMLDRMSQVYDIQEYQQSFYSAQKGYYSQTGELQGVIAYINREIDALNEQNGTLESNIQKIEEYMTAKKAELDTMDITDEEYKTVADDLDKLQDAHQKYTKELISNKTSLESLTEAIQEQQDKIRKMEIDLRNTILKAIQDREKRAEDMLNGEIEMENTILDLIKKRYEKERDQIIDTNQLKIDSLQKERDLLSEQLQLRKQQAEEEDKAKQLAQYEAQYQRILADPTRRKEAMELYKKIHDLRDEMAWDAAEKEVKSQQDSIDQQVESLEDYIEYVQNYYEDLFEHPQKLIEEMKSIITKTDEEIIEWLKANDEEYAKSTENTQKTMVQSWQDTLDQMHDVLKTYWDEIEFIIEQGDEYIINFLKENSADYREAGKLQAEAYVDEWKKQLSDLEKAHRQVVAEIADSYAVIEQASSESSKKGGGGGGGGGGGNGGDDSGNTEAKKYWHVHGVDQQKRQTVMGATYDTKESAESAAKKAEQYYGWSDTKVSYYKNGGIASKTGLAWLDGTMEEPERILSPYQTKLFETMVDALDSISRISIPGMPNYGDVQKTGGGSVSVGDIVVNVDNLDTDDDYEELAEKVSAVLMERIGRTAAIGGLHIRSI